MRRITVANQKGGVGKSTLVVNLGWALAAMGKSVLIVDADPQGNATSGLLGGQVEPDNTLYGIFTGSDVAPVNICKHLDLIPGDIALASADLEFSQEFGRERKLSKALKSLSYDYQLIDSPPSLGLMTINSLCASDEVLIPVSPSFWALRGIELLEQTIFQVREGMDVEIRLTGAVLTMMDRTNVSRDAREILQDHFGSQLFKSEIPKTVKVEEANANSQSIIEFAPGSGAAVAYKKLAEEVDNG